MEVAHFITIADDIYFVYLVGVCLCFAFAAEEFAPCHLRDQAERYPHEIGHRHVQILPARYLHEAEGGVDEHTGVWV